MEEVKVKKYRSSILLKFAILCLTAFFIYMLANQYMQIGEKKEQLSDLQDEVRVQEIVNDELQYSLDNEDNLADYAEKAARKEFSYAKPQERVFINIGGSD